MKRDKDFGGRPPSPFYFAKLRCNERLRRDQQTAARGSRHV